MLTSPEPDRNIEELHDDEIYAAIRYLERKPPTPSKKSDAPVPTQNDDKGVAICVCLYFALLGCLVFVWLYWR